MRRPHSFAAMAARFPNLDGLRFLAAALVVLDHLQQHRANLGLPHWGDLHHWERLGHLGVLLFFVLSGFLITFLLLEEERETGRIHYGRFQVRRVLRIWPLYFLLVVLSLYVFPALPWMDMPDAPAEAITADRPRKLLLYALFVPSLVPSLAGPVPHAGHLWTIGTEVHFYLLWPLLLLLVRKHRLWLAVAVMLSYPLGMRMLGSAWAAVAVPHQQLVLLYWSQANLESLGLGALCAILAFRGGRPLDLLLNRHLFRVAVVAAVILVLFGMPLGPRAYKVGTFLFGFIILNLAVNPAVGKPLEWEPLRYLGRISYGIYMYHLAVIVGVVNVLLAIDRVHDVLLYPLVFGVTIGVSALSFRYFEGFFQGFRKRWLRRTG